MEEDLRVKKQHLDCLAAVEQVLSSNRYIRHLLGALQDRGCNVGKSFFMCEQCPAGMLIGGYWDSQRGVVVCENVPRSSSQIGRTMMHELVHAYDWCRVDFNPTSCLHNACTEIRAANLSGDCNLAMEVIRGRGWSFTKHKQDCVRRIATTSLRLNPNCAASAEESVDLAWAMCWKDTMPWDHVP